MGQNLVCPSCKNSFEAVEVEEGNGVRVFRSERFIKMGSVNLKTKMGNVGSKRKMVSGHTKKKGSASSGFEGESGDSGKEVGGGGDWGRCRLRRRTSSVGEVLTRSKPKHVEDEQETMTFAEMQAEAKRRANQEKLKFRQKEKEREKVGDKEREIRRNKASKNRDLELKVSLWRRMIPRERELCGYKEECGFKN